MYLKECSGYELVKEKPNTSEDYFNCSVVTYTENGKERTLHVVYLRYFEESLEQYVPYTSDPLFTAGERDIWLKDIIALLCFMHNKENTKRKRIFIHSQSQFAECFENVDYNKVENIFQALQRDGSYHLGV